MKTFFALGLCLLFSLGLLAQKTETRPLSGFTRLSIAVPAEVRLSKGPFKVSLEGEDLEEVITQVKGDELVIRRKSDNWSFFSNSKKITILISMPVLEAVAMSGSGKLESPDLFKSNSMKINLSGSGRVQLNLETDQLETHVSGSGNVETSGSARSMKAHISGSGKVRAEQLRTRDLEAHISGSGSCNVHVDGKLDARISGSGSVNYTGNPTSINASTSGSGRVSKRG